MTNKAQDEIAKFISRLEKIGIKTTYKANYPWIYLDTVNGKKVEGNLHSEHAFTAFFLPVKVGQTMHMTDISTIFNKIRETLNA